MWNEYKEVRCPLCGETARITYEENKLYQLSCVHCHNSLFHQDNSFDDAEKFFNRIIYSPCAVGDKIYRINPGNYYSNHKPFIQDMEVTEISWKKSWNKDLGIGVIANGCRYKIPTCGRTWFTTKEEAEVCLNA